MKRIFVVVWFGIGVFGLPFSLHPVDKSLSPLVTGNSYCTLSWKCTHENVSETQLRSVSVVSGE